MTHRFFWRIGLFFLVAVLLTNGLWFIALPVFLLYLFWYNGYEFLFLAWCIDVYFAPTPFTFWYTSVAAVALFGAIIIRPYVRLFDREVE